MIKKMLSLILISLPILDASENESIDQISLQAQALWEARDYEGAEALYEQLLTRKLPPWQQARLEYNLGSIKLAQHQMTESIGRFQKISSDRLSLPRFSRDLFLNQGIAYLQFVQAQPSQSAYNSEQILYLRNGLKALEKAQDLGCRVQQMEQEREASACSPQHMIDGWIKATLFKLDAVHQQMAQKWSETASIESLATFLSILLQQMIAEVKGLQDVNKTASSIESLIPYYQRQTESLSPIWDALKKKKFSKTQLASFDQAADAYLKALKAFQKKDIPAALSDLAHSSEKLGPLSYDDHIDLRLAHLNYDILLLQPSLTAIDIQSVQWEVDQLKEEKNQSQALEAVKEYLKLGLQALKDQDSLKARFFLLAGFGELDSLLPAKEISSLAALQQALDQANRSLQLLLLAQLIPQKSSLQEKRKQILSAAQQAVLTRADRFILAVLKDQASHYQEANGPNSGCQQSPWDQVIPLFDHGFLSAQGARELLEASSDNPQMIAAQQEQTLQDWQQALNLLMNPPQQSQQNKTGGASSSTPKNLADTFRLVQEMYLEDQAQPEPESKELHSW